MSKRPTALKVLAPTEADSFNDFEEVDLDELGLDLEIPAALRDGYELRSRNFGDAVSFYAPSVKRYETDEFSNCGTCSFIGVSVTGPGCALQCDHCQAGILAPMVAATSPERLWEVAVEQAARGSGGLLISGGSDRHNVVRMERHVDVMRRIREELGLRILVHVGFADATVAAALASVPVDSVMLDIIGSDETIHEVYHLPWASRDNYRRTLESLAEVGLPLSPHVVIGLHYGQLRGEFEALEMISKVPIRSLVLVGLQPLKGTPMADCAPPTPAQMGEVFIAARRQFPTVDILLGCERPHGEHKLRTDELALKAGLNGIAYPAEGIVTLARALGLRSSMSSMCCSLKFQGI